MKKELLRLLAVVYFILLVWANVYAALDNIIKHKYVEASLEITGVLLSVVIISKIYDD